MVIDVGGGNDVGCEEDRGGQRKEIEFGGLGEGDLGVVDGG